MITQDIHILAHQGFIKSCLLVENLNQGFHASILVATFVEGATHFQTVSSLEDFKVQDKSIRTL
jgi:hypothetical protein